MDDVLLRVTNWEAGADKALLQQVRRRVFVLEQRVPEAEEWDDDDAVAAHVLATRNREPVGTGRLTPAGKIGRLAVLSEFRGKGVGSRILRMLVHEAVHRGLSEAVLHAQVQALPFYEKHGFVAEGPVFEEAGIPHRKMCRRLG
jgi:predicted GNAT family N-acyltransferase